MSAKRKYQIILVMKGRELFPQVGPVCCFPWGPAAAGRGLYLLLLLLNGSYIHIGTKVSLCVSSLVCKLPSTCPPGREKPRGSHRLARWGPCPRRRLKGSPLFRPEGRDGPWQPSCDPQKSPWVSFLALLPRCQWLWVTERCQWENDYEVDLNATSQVQGSSVPCLGVQMGKPGFRELSD